MHPNGSDLKHPIFYPEILASFAKYGVHCTVIQPDWLDINEGTGEIFNLAVQSDIIILDWKMENEDEGRLALDLLKMLSEEAISSLPQKLRLILIYSGENIDEIKAKLETVGYLDSDGHEFDFVSKGLKIVVLKKHTTVDGSSDEGQTEVGFSDLADKSIEYFAFACNGLVPTAAMNALSVVRESGHMILRRFGPDIDYPALVHRSAIPTSEDAEQFITALLSSEIGEIVTKENPGIILKEGKSRFPVDKKMLFQTGKCSLELGVHDFLQFGLWKCVKDKIECTKKHPDGYLNCINGKVKKEKATRMDITIRFILKYIAVSPFYC